ADLGIVQQLNLANLGTVQSGFTLDFTVTVNGVTHKISQTFVSQNHAAGSPTTSTVSTSGATSYTDNLTATQPGANNTWIMVDSVNFVTSGATDATDLLTNVTYTITQTPVPEPSTFALAGLAVAGLVFARRRAR
ncbi:MAG: PEP-CTERM sorting domain-containing protein, partial [Planctomycetaceae bacterium]